MDYLSILYEKLKDKTTIRKTTHWQSKTPILHLNVQLINPISKQLTLLNYLMLNEIERVILTETWLDTKTFRENFTFFWQFEVVTMVDRPDDQHGGASSSSEKNE